MKTDISKLNPCSDGAKYYESQPDFKTAWENCQRGDWMLWLASKIEVDRRTITLAKGLCAKTVLHLMKDERSIKAVEVAIEYGKGTVTDDALRRSYTNASCAADAAAVTVYAASGSVYAAYAASAAAFGADSGADSNADSNAASSAAFAAAKPAASDVAYDASDAAAYTDALRENRMQTANICREVLTDAVYKKLGL